MIYKNYNVTLPRGMNESDEEYQSRLWFVNKNIHLIDIEKENGITIDELIGYSFIHVKIDKYNHYYNDNIMRKYIQLLDNLFTY